MNHTEANIISNYRNSTTSRKLWTISLNPPEQNINLSVVFIILHNRHPQLTILLLKTSGSNRCQFNSKELTSRLKMGAMKLMMTIYSLTIKVGRLCKPSLTLNPSKVSLRSQQCLQSRKTL